MITVIKNIRMFALILDQGIYVIKNARIFLYPFDCLYLRYEAVQISCSPLHFFSDGSLVGSERRAAFLVLNISNFVTTMTKENEICTRAKHSTPSATADARQALIQYFTENYPAVKRLKIKDHKCFFVARARYGQRVLHAKAYSLERLANYFRQEFETKVLGKEVCHA